MPAEFDAVELLRVLVGHEVEFVVIGGFAAWIQGAPLVTVDLDIVYEPSAENAARLVDALAELGAIYRHQLGRHIEPNVKGLTSQMGAGHHLFETKFGDLDALRTAAADDFASLVPATDRFDFDGAEVRVVRLARIIELKRAAGRPKDVAALPVLEATLASAPADD